MVIKDNGVEDGPPNGILRGKGRVRSCGVRFVRYAQGEKTLAVQSTGVLIRIGSVSLELLAAATASAYVSPLPTTWDSSADRAIQLSGFAARSIATLSSGFIIASPLGKATELTL